MPIIETYCENIESVLDNVAKILKLQLCNISCSLEDGIMCQVLSDEMIFIEYFSKI